MTYISPFEVAFYGAGYRATDDREYYWVCGYDFSKPIEERAWRVEGETGAEWTEVHEMAEHFTWDQDGCVYFVGDGEAVPLRPSYKEIKEILKRRKEDSKYETSPSEEVALAIYYGVIA